jgi:allophanate hydrolase
MMTDPNEAAKAAISADHAHADPAMWITRRSDEAIREDAARLADEGKRGRPLWGVPFAVKDNIDVAGLPTTAACPGWTRYPTVSAPAVQQLLEAGALLMGKTNLDQFATGLVGVRSPYGIPRNAFNAAFVPGGSSSGSGVAVASGIVQFALGTDTAGSGRVPAAFGNIVGLKPTVGGVSNSGMVPACRSIDTISVFASSVDETLAIARVIGGYDANDPYSRQAPRGWLARGGLAPGLKVGVADVAALCDEEVTAAYQSASAGFACQMVDLAPFLEIARLLYEGPWVAERTDALRAVLDMPGDILLPVTRQIIAAGLERRTVDAFSAFHRLALARRAAQTLFAQVDALVLPTAPFCPSLAELEADPIGPNSRLGTFTNFVNLCDLAAIAVPAGFAKNGMPIGVTVLGPAWSEGRIAAIADAIHRASATTIGATKLALPPADTAVAVHSDETALFCIGAHMSGLTLNPQLTELGGRFVRQALTAPHYRLFALGERPGLLRDVSGAAIAGEVWALPTAAIGALLARVPAPLCFGEVGLQDGPCLGFLAEAAGVIGAQDITEFGGWRAFVGEKGTAPE